MKKAFTLVELLVVVAILGILGTVVIIRFTGTQSTARDTRRQSDLRQYQNALEVYANRSNSLYPIQTAAVNVTTLCGTLNLTNCPDDPQATNSYRYQSTAGGLNYVLWSRLERPNQAGNIEYFILCSTGQAGKLTAAPSSGNCPI